MFFRKASEQQSGGAPARRGGRSAGRMIGLLQRARHACWQSGKGGSGGVCRGCVQFNNLFTWESQLGLFHAVVAGCVRESSSHAFAFRTPLGCSSSAPCLRPRGGRSFSSVEREREREREREPRCSLMGFNIEHFFCALQPEPKRESAPATAVLCTSASNTSRRCSQTLASACVSLEVQGPESRQETQASLYE